MWTARLGAVILVATTLAGCGTYVPGIPEFPSQPNSTQLLVKAILDSIHCEIKGSVKFVIRI